MGDGEEEKKKGLEGNLGQSLPRETDQQLLRAGKAGGEAGADTWMTQVTQVSLQAFL